MAITYWNGSGSAVSGSTPYGFYDADAEFQAQAPRVAKWCAMRLGYPVVQIELQDVHFYACFEEAINEYGAQVNQINIKDNLYSVKGKPTNVSLNGKNISASPLNTIIDIAKDYGAEVGAGGNLTWHKGSIDLVAGQQTYDLNTMFTSSITMRRLFHQRVPASTRYLQPFGGMGSINNLIDQFGFNSYGQNTMFILAPLQDDLLFMNRIELSDTIRRSHYSFEITNNQLKIFPIPTDAIKLWFDYTLDTERYTRYDNGSAFGTQSVITDYSNIPYDSLVYSDINDVGKQWIRRYTLALSKEMLGNIRSKFGSIPIPDGEVSMDGDTLRTEATAERDALITELRETLEETSKKAQMQAQTDIADQVQNQLSKVPGFIYLG